MNFIFQGFWGFGVLQELEVLLEQPVVEVEPRLLGRDVGRGARQLAALAGERVARQRPRHHVDEEGRADEHGDHLQDAPDHVNLVNFQGVYLSPQQAKALWNVLGQNLAQYEQAFGELQLEPRLPDFPAGTVN